MSSLFKITISLSLTFALSEHVDLTCLDRSYSGALLCVSPSPNILNYSEEMDTASTSWTRGELDNWPCQALPQQKSSGAVENHRAGV